MEEKFRDETRGLFVGKCNHANYYDLPMYAKLEDGDMTLQVYKTDDPTDMLFMYAKRDPNHEKRVLDANFLRKGDTKITEETLRAYLNMMAIGTLKG